MLSVFGDDSADETKQRVFAIGAVIASESQWKALESRWIERTDGIPFHATDCDSDNGAYAESSHQENKTLYKDLITILAESEAWGYGAAVDLAGHREFFPGVPQEMDYHFCFTRVVNFLTRFTGERFAQTVKFSFDNRIETNFNAGLIYSQAMADETFPYREYMHDEVSFLCSRKNLRIQIGDLFAREIMKHLDNMVGPVKRPERKSMSALIATKRFGGDFYAREYFQDKLKRWPELEKKAGFTIQDYWDWLTKRNMQDSITNRFMFTAWLDAQEKKSGI
jgi:hypothetical protein